MWMGGGLAEREEEEEEEDERGEGVVGEVGGAE